MFDDINTIDNDLDLDFTEEPENKNLNNDDLTNDSENSDIFEEGFEEENIQDNDVLNDFLKSKGIENSIIKIVDENNEEKELNFYDLSKDEQLEILNSFNQPDEQPKEEPKDIKFLRELEKNNLSVEDFLVNYKEEILKEAGTQQPVYEIDSYDDNELFLLDLKSKYDLTDEELVSELEKELKNEDLFKKKVTALREDYKKLEDEYKQVQQSNLQKEEQDKYDKFSEKMVDIAVKTEDLHGIELENTEKEEVLSYLLDLDDKGLSNFYKDLNSPEKLYEAAWFLRYGKEAFDALKDAYESEIAKLKKDKPNKVVIKNNDNKQQLSSIYDLN